MKAKSQDLVDPSESSLFQQEAQKLLKTPRPRSTFGIPENAAAIAAVVQAVAAVILVYLEIRKLKTVDGKPRELDPKAPRVQAIFDTVPGLEDLGAHVCDCAKRIADGGLAPKTIASLEKRLPSGK